jgi:hypothetical protein
LASQFCQTVGDNLFFSSPYWFESWQTPSFAKQKMQNRWSCSNLRVDESLTLLLVNCSTPRNKSSFWQVMDCSKCSREIAQCNKVAKYVSLTTTTTPRFQTEAPIYSARISNPKKMFVNEYYSIVSKKIVGQQL